MEQVEAILYQHAQGGKRLHEAGGRPEHGDAEAEESESNAAYQDTCKLPHTVHTAQSCAMRHRYSRCIKTVRTSNVGCNAVQYSLCV